VQLERASNAWARTGLPNCLAESIDEDRQTPIVFRQKRRTTIEAKAGLKSRIKGDNNVITVLVPLWLRPRVRPTVRAKCWFDVDPIAAMAMPPGKTRLKAGRNRATVSATINAPLGSPGPWSKSPFLAAIST